MLPLVDALLVCSHSTLFLLRRYTTPQPCDLKGVEKFAAPSEGSLHAGHNWEFSLQGGDGSRVYGFCRGVPGGWHGLSDDECVVICVLSRLPWYKHMRLILEAAEFSGNAEKADEFMAKVAQLHRGPPVPAERLQCNGGGVSLDLVLPALDVDMSDERLDVLLRRLPIPKLLLERRVIMIGTRLSVVTACVMAAERLLYPFAWQHIFLPLVPSHLVHVVCAPMPFLCGLLRENEAEVKAMPTEAVVWVDLDSGKLSFEEQDVNILPPNHTRAMTEALYKVMDSSPLDSPPGINPSLAVSWPSAARIFLEFFLFLLVPYRQFMRGGGPVDRRDTTEKRFDIDGFVNSLTPTFVDFMRRLRGSQMWEGFLSHRLGVYSSGLTASVFERAVLYFETHCRGKLGGWQPMGVAMEEQSHMPSYFRDLRVSATQRLLDGVLGEDWDNHTEVSAGSFHSVADGTDEARNGIASLLVENHQLGSFPVLDTLSPATPSESLL